MRHINTVIFIAALLFLPAVASAACSPVGYTVEFMNGIATSNLVAEESKALLQEALPRELNKEPVTVRLAYNEEHIGAVADVLQAIAQALFNSISDYNLHSMLRQIASDDTTQKLLLVGHSQGALYANSIYDYVTNHGETNRAVDIYAIATPASYVAGGGKYGTSYDDAVIMAVRALARKFDAPAPLPSNLLVMGGASFPDLLATHHLGTYISGAGDEMSFVMKEEMAALTSSFESTSSDCFTPPGPTLGDRVQQAAFALVDPVANAAEAKAMLVYNNAVHAVIVAAALTRAVSTAIAKVLGGAQTILSNPSINPTVPENYEKNFQIVKSLYGSSLEKEDYEGLNGNQGGAVALVLPPGLATVSSVESLPVHPTSSEPLRLAYILDSGPGGGPAPDEDPPDHSSELVTNPAPTEDASSGDMPPPNDATSTDSGVDDMLMSPELTPEVHGSPVTDTFDNFNTAGWQTTGGNVKSFDVDNGTQNICVRGGCVIGIATNDFLNVIPRGFLKGPVAQAEGAFSVYIRVVNTLVAPVVGLSLCNSASAECPDEKSISVIGFTVNDGVWHHYYFAWRQGISTIQTCFMQDDMRPSYCTWNEDTGIPNGSTFDGVGLWLQASYRNDLGTNVWFDELEAQ